jgi:hypothetical protein
MLNKELSRIQHENFFLNKANNMKIEDRSLIKGLQKTAKKIVKPFKGL